MKSKATSLLSVKSALKEKCVCGQGCMKNLNFKTVRDLRNAFWLNSKTMRMQLLRSYIFNSHKYGKYRFLKVEQMKLCSKAFRIVLHINKNTFSLALQMSEKNIATIPGKKPRDMSEKTLQLMSWLEEYSTYHGDRMPDTSDILLPYRTIKSDLYYKYVSETRHYTSPEYSVSRAQFFKTWKMNFPHLKIKKVIIHKAI
jgi:hypothetical protein